MKTKKNVLQNGFTIMELLIVVTIIAIISVAVLISINARGQIGKTGDARRKADLSTLKKVLEDFYNDKNRYPTVPAVRMGRLAVDQAFQGQGLGGALLADALYRAARSEIAAYALMVDAKDEPAAAFYQHHGFITLPDSPLALFLPLATVPLHIQPT